MSLASFTPHTPNTEPGSGPGQPSPRRAPLQILVVDDDTAILKFIESVLTSKGITPTLATTVAGAEEALAKNPEFGVILCDHLLPDGLGVQLLHDLRDQQPNLVRILMTGLYDKVLALEAINSGEIYRFLLKPFAVEDLLATVSQAFDRHQLAVENSRLHSQLALQNEELRRANAELSRRVRASEAQDGPGAETAEWRAKAQPWIDVALGFLQGVDPLLYSHGHRVSVLATAIGQEMNLPAETLEKLDLAALFHDVGLLGSDPRLRSHQRQTGPLTPDELEQIEHHPNLSAQLVKFLPYDVTEAIRQHHEYFDGSGYPGQLAGDRISHLARILSVADCYDEGAEGNGTGNGTEPVLPRLMAGAGRLHEADVLHALDRALSKGTMPTVRQVLVSELTEGMKLSSSIYTKTGMLLVKQGQVLSRPIIEHLQLHAESNAIIQKILIEA